MVDAVEVSIESALLDRYNLFGKTSPDTLYRAQPNITSTPPVAGAFVWWVRATFLPADSFALGIDYGASNQHYGIFQVDVFFGQNSGDLEPGRRASEVIQWFNRGTRLTKNGFNVDIVKAPYRGQLMKSDPWVMIPISIPYLAFAPNPA